MLDHQIIYVTGLPRSGSTLLCQLLAHHPEIYCPGHSSPLCQTLTGLRYSLSDNDFLLAQMDPDFDRTYQRLGNAFRGFINGWFAETDRRWVVDKNRGWLQHLELVNHLDPNFKMVVCIRELGQIYGSIEAQHQRTVLLDFPDHLANLSRYGRATHLFGNSGVVGVSLGAIESLQDIDSQLQQHLFYIIFEDLLSEPLRVMQSLLQWLGMPVIEWDFQNLTMHPHESDSYYRFKYSHQTYAALREPELHLIPARIQAELQRQFSWFYQTFYPGLVEGNEP